MTTIAAYVLSRKAYWSQKLMFLVTFTMFFSGGIVPFYLTVKDLGLEGSRLALIPVSYTHLDVYKRQEFEQLGQYIELSQNYKKEIRQRLDSHREILRKNYLHDLLFGIAQENSAVQESLEGCGVSFTSPYLSLIHISIRPRRTAEA